MNKKLTVGYIEDLLRPFSKGTEVELNCGCCHHGSIGSEDILKLHNNTNQTYGYISLEFNASSEGEAELNPNKEKWYKAEINKLKEQIKIKDRLIEEYADILKLQKDSLERNINWIERIKSGKF